MNIIVCCKFAPDTQDIETRMDGSISLDKAVWKISEYDLQAIEAGARLAEATGGKCIAVSVGSPRIDASQFKKDLLSRGPDELYLVIDSNLANEDIAVVSTILSEVVKKVGADVVLFGEGSSDNYFQQTGLQVGEKLNWATLNAIDAIESVGDKLKVERLLENEIEVLEIPLPAALTLTSSINNPPVPGMKAVLSAGKKPVTVLSLAELGLDNLAAHLEIVSTSAPKDADRKRQVITGTVAEAVAELVRCLDSEGVI